MSNNEKKAAKENPDTAEDIENKENVQEIECEDVKNPEDEVSCQDEEITKLNKEVETLKDLLQRRQADFENFRKRTAKLQEDYRKLAIKDFACDIINVNDDINRAIEASDSLSTQENPASSDSSSKDSFIEGIKLVSKRIEETLNKYGIEEIESENKPFNPNFHEALEIADSTDQNEDTVTKVYQKGFKLDEYVLRTAKVRVSKPAPKNNGAV
jgi:molecular chaperone GrpE